jgi:hypothetical protein
MNIYQSKFFSSKTFKDTTKNNQASPTLFYLNGDLGSGKSYVTLKEMSNILNNDSRAKFLVVTPTIHLGKNHADLITSFVDDPERIHSIKSSRTKPAIQSFTTSLKVVMKEGGVIIITHALFNTFAFQNAIKKDAKHFIHIMDELDSKFHVETSGRFPYSYDFILENFDFSQGEEQFIKSGQGEYVIAGLSQIGKDRLFSSSDTVLNQFLGDHLVNARMGSPIIFIKKQLDRIKKDLSKRTGSNHQLNITSFQHPSLYSQFKESLIISGDFEGSMIQQIWKYFHDVNWVEADYLSSKLRTPNHPIGNRLKIYPIFEDNFSKNIRDKIDQKTSMTYFDIAMDRIKTIIKNIPEKNKKILFSTNNDVDDEVIVDNFKDLKNIKGFTKISTRCHGLNDYSDYNIGIFLAALNQNPHSSKLLQDFDFGNVDLTNSNNREAINQFAVRGNLRKYNSNETSYLLAMDLRSSLDLQKRYPGSIIDESFMIQSIDGRKKHQESSFNRNIYNANKRFEAVIDELMVVNNTSINEESCVTKNAQNFTMQSYIEALDDSVASGSLRSPEVVGLGSLDHTRDSSSSKNIFAQNFTMQCYKYSFGNDLGNLGDSTLLHRVIDEHSIKFYLYDSIGSKYDNGHLKLSRTSLFKILKASANDRIVESKHENKLFLTTTTTNGRKKIDAELVHAITLDFDGGKTTMKEAKKIIKKKRIYSAVIYETTSSDGREDPNRFRVVINLSRSMTPTEYGYVIKEVASWFDEESGLDRGKLYETAIFYLPARLASKENKPQFMKCYRDASMIETHCLDVDYILEHSKVVKKIKAEEHKRKVILEMYQSHDTQKVTDFNKIRSFTGTKLVSKLVSINNTKNPSKTLLNKLLNRIETEMKPGNRSTLACSIAGAGQYLNPDDKNELFYSMVLKGIDKAAQRSVKNYMKI